jgi:predicted DCC family thiol-disulfide oxidoreductase YuxK
MKKVLIYYDGDCPVCNRYAAYTKLKSEFDLELVNLRDNQSALIDLTNQGYDLDEGMLVEIEDVKYYGSDAVYVLSILGSDESHVVLKIAQKVLKNKTASSYLYPILKFGRMVLLKLLRRNKLNENPS